MLILKVYLSYVVVFFKAIIRAGASIGADATILPGIEIGSGVMIGACSVVTNNVAPNLTVVGNLAREIIE